MSIPPLVCSTPPPPEQCEDDKDPEDYDLHYNLSQEDDENNDLEFGSFSTYMHTSENNKKSNPLPTENKVESVACDSAHDVNEASQEGFNHIPDLPFEDDVHIEDLNLEINQEPIISSTKSDQEVSDINSGDKIVKDLQTDIPVDSNNGSPNNFNLSSFNDDNTTEPVPMGQVDKPEIDVKITELLSDKNHLASNEEGFINVSRDNDEDNASPKEPTDENIAKNIDEFEDFDDFKFISSDNKSEMVIESTDPWGSDTPDVEGFGDFTANFEHVECVTEGVGAEEECLKSNLQTQSQNTNNDDDDFGDFDEFKSSPTEDKLNIEPTETIQNQEVPVWNFQSSSENQIIESINKVLETIFPEEISESEDGLQNKLEISLGETWSYLKETDTRQPYIVNWNNSLAQKILLKALCIDSRNILFGPKWSFNTPKYAANLSAAPLQPQKQTTQINMSGESSSDVDVKAANKTSWVDPFASDGHESCNVENENNVSETGPTDLDVFEAAMSTNTDKIYSSTLNIQPIRQINLPDTHIFTPTDSETPRSKTIHYNNNTTHSMLIPQPVPSTITQKQPEEFPSKSAEIDPQNEDEYWDFQDFRGNPDIKSPSVDKKFETKSSDTTVDKSIQPTANNYTLETQVLQPIKLEPIIPTLNWPDPGEVKETFDDFSDFVSKSPPADEKQDSVPQTLQESSMVKNAENLQATFETTHKDTNSTKQIHNVEDEFDMFQSALPTTTNVPSHFNNSDISLFNQKPSTQIAPNDLKISKTEQTKTDNISFLNTRPTEPVTQRIGNSSNFDDHSLKTQSSGIQLPNCNILQPTVASSTQQSQQKTGQILQPLSLESYSQINWPNPGIDLQDLSRFNPVESLQSFKSDVGNHSKNASPIHNHKVISNNQVSDEDIWGEFVSSKPKPQQAQSKKQPVFADDDEWTDFVSSPSVNTQNGLNTISFNVHTNSGIQKSSSTKYPLKKNEAPLEIPTLNYITPKTANQKTYNERHFQNL